MGPNDPSRTAAQLARACELEQHAVRAEEKALDEYLETGMPVHLTEYELANNYRWRVAQVVMRLEARGEMLTQLPSQSASQGEA